MIRDSQGGADYWQRWTAFDDQIIAQVWSDLAKPSGNPTYRPQYCFELARHHWQAMLRRYSAGHSIAELAQYFDGLLRAWERSEELGEPVFTAEQKALRSSWANNLDFYITCFWLTGLALALEIPQAQWQRLVALMLNEGEDALLDRIIATRSPGRRIGTRLLHERPYARLLVAVEAPTPGQQAQALADFVRHWHAELDRKGTKRLPANYARPYWHRFGDENFEGGAYFGRWCVEAVAAVKAFGLDDSLCLGHPHYPGDLLRPAGPGTHGRTDAVAGPEAAAAPAASGDVQPAPPPRAGLWQRLFGKR